MSGSALAPLIIPIVVVPALAIWLIMVYYADSHPWWRTRGQLPAQRDSEPGTAALPGPVVDVPAPRRAEPEAASAEQPVAATRAG